MQQKVLVSVDTEGPAGQLPVERMIYGQAVDGKEYGINFLMRLFEKNSIKALFFVDITFINRFFCFIFVWMINLIANHKLVLSRINI